VRTHNKNFEIIVFDKEEIDMEFRKKIMQNVRRYY
jgi:hypothetical protein